MTSKLLIDEFIEAIRERAEAEFRGKLQQAFVGWFVEAEFGRVDWKFTDDAGDGGIDAVVWRPGEQPSVIIVQSKFSEHVGRASLAPNAYREFSRVIDAFRHKDEKFNDFLAQVREDARRTYRKAQEELSADSWFAGKRAFRLITTCNRRSGMEHGGLPRSAYRYSEDILALYEQYRRGHTPRSRDLQLRVEDKLPYRDPQRGVTSYLFNARVHDFRRYFDGNDVGRLVARNIRYNLAGRIGRDIRATYEDDPTNFWYVHNGLTIVCDDYVEQDQIATLVNPSVVNGAQTLYAIAGSNRKASSALVATRVIVRSHQHKLAHEDDVWVQAVIRGVNTQNRVRTQDFRSNEPEQLELQNLFRDQKVFYERKRGEWREFRNEPRFRSFDRTSIRTIGMVLTATSERDGSGVVLLKRGVEAIFESKNYRRLFPSRNTVGRRFERIYLGYRIARLVRKCGYRTQAEYRKQRHAFWTTVWLVHAGLTDIERFYTRSTIKSIREAFDRFESSDVVGRQARSLIKKTRGAVWSAWRKARRVDVERWNANNFFKSKWGHGTVRTLAFPKVRKELKNLGAALLG